MLKFKTLILPFIVSLVFAISVYVFLVPSLIVQVFSWWGIYLPFWLVSNTYVSILLISRITSSGLKG